MNIISLVIIFWMSISSSNSTQPLFSEILPIDYQKVAAELLEAIKWGYATKEYVHILSNSTEEQLTQQLDSDTKKIAFWVNIYNAFIQLTLKEHPEYYNDRRQYFKTPHVKIAGRQMSFADIEHGIIRRSQFEYFLGYIRNPFVKSYKKKLRPKKSDFRVHFALNCGAKSCPPVVIYTPENLDAQFDRSAKLFLQNFSSYDAKTNRVLTTSLFSWFRGDFGGKRGTKKILHRYGIVPSAEVELSYDNYDWTLYLDNFLD